MVVLLVARWVRRAWRRGGVAARRAVGASRMVAGVVTCPLVARCPTPKGKPAPTPRGVYGCVNGFAAVNVARIYCFYDGYWWFFWGAGCHVAHGGVVAWLLVARFSHG